MMAGFGHFKVVSVDYRMPPDHPYPAALDDAMTVWKAASKTTDPKNMGVFGSSAGGALTLSMVLRAKRDNGCLQSPNTPPRAQSGIGAHKQPIEVIPTEAHQHVLLPSRKISNVGSISFRGSLNGSMKGDALTAEQACRKRCPIVPIYPQFDAPPGITVTSLFPHFVDAQQSAMQGLNVGWYAIDQDGGIASGPDRGRNECAISIAQSPNDAPALCSRP